MHISSSFQINSSFCSNYLDIVICGQAKSITPALLLCDFEVICLVHEKGINLLSFIFELLLLCFKLYFVGENSGDLQRCIGAQFIERVEYRASYSCMT